MVPVQLFERLRCEARQRDMHLVVGDLPDEQLADGDALPRILREWSVDGLLVYYTHMIPPRMRELMSRHRIPSVWLNTQLPADSVYPNELTGGREATERLIALGHRRIAYYQPAYPDDKHYSQADRKSGYEQAMAAAGLEPRLFRTDHTMSRPDRRQRCRELLSGGDRPTAVVAYDPDDGAVIHLAAATLGLEIGRDVSVVTFRANATTSIASTRFDIMQIPAAAMATRGVEMLARKIESPDEELPSVVLPLTYLNGETVGPAPAGI
jgi:DNA-binding LacI/PurR family transcriptional regulator